MATIGQEIRKVVVVDEAGTILNLAPGLVPDNFDYISIAYDGSNRISTVTYKTGGSGGTVVGTLTLTYDGTSARILTVTKT